MASTSEIRAAAEAENKILTLQSSDGEEFTIPQSAAVRSETIKNMIDDGCADAVIPLLNVEAKQLSQIVLYLKSHGGGTLELREFDKDFLSGEPAGELLDCLMAANYLCVGDLVDLLAVKIADSIKDEGVDNIRALFRIQSEDFIEAAEEERIRAEYAWAFEGASHP